MQINLLLEWCSLLLAGCPVSITLARGDQLPPFSVSNHDGWDNGSKPGSNYGIKRFVPNSVATPGGE